VTFAKIRTNRQVPSGVFAIPHKVGWDVTRRPLKKAGKLLP
jgi:hypothetical protein